MATTLAELVGLSPASISHYEGNRHAPNEGTLERLAETLGVPICRFFKPSHPARDRVLFWRSRHAATQLQRARSYRRHLWLLDIVDFLHDHIEFPCVALPELDVPSDPLTVSLEQIDDLALAVREVWGLGDGPIADLVAVLERHGAIVAKTSIGADQVDAFSEWRVEDDRPYITLASDKQSDCRSRMDAAHELGHMLLHRNVALRDFNKAACHSWLEAQAGRFAAALLLPAVAFADDLYSHHLEAFRELKERWRVSIAAMIHRAHEIGLLDDDQYRKLWISMGRRKWKRREPGDDDVIPEEPKLLRQAFDMLLDSGTIDPRRMELELGLRLRDIESLVGLPAGYLNNDSSGPLKFRRA